jgi:hypothetical protein
MSSYGNAGIGYSGKRRAIVLHVRRASIVEPRTRCFGKPEDMTPSRLWGIPCAHQRQKPKLPQEMNLASVAPLCLHPTLATAPGGRDQADIRRTRAPAVR